MTAWALNSLPRIVHLFEGRQFRLFGFAEQFIIGLFNGTCIHAAIIVKVSATVHQQINLDES